MDDRSAANFSATGREYFFSSITEMGPSSWLPYFIEEASGASQTLSITALMIFGAIMAVGRISTASVVQHWGPRRFFIGAGLLCSTSLILTEFTTDTGLTIFLMCFMGLCFSWVFPTFLGYAGDRFPQACPSMFAILVSTAIAGGLPRGLRPAMAALALAPLAFLILPQLIKESDR